MAITREHKEELVKQYAEYLDANKGMIVADFRGLRVTDMERLRRSLRQNDVIFHVIRKRLFRLALEQAGVAFPQEWLDGPTAIAFCLGEMPLAAKAVSDFAKDAPLLSVKGGVLDGLPVSAEQVAALGSLPTREVLLAQLLGTINAPASQVAGVVSSGIRQVLNVLQAHVDKLQDQGPEPQAA